MYRQELCTKICDLSFINNGLVDKVVWFHAPNRVYTAKSGYSWLMLKKIGFGPHRVF